MDPELTETAVDGLPAECPLGEIWQHGELGPCEKTCPEMNNTQARSNCTEARVPGCVCQLGRFRSQTGLCVPEDHCECWHHGSPHLVRQQALFLSRDPPSTGW